MQKTILVYALENGFYGDPTSYTFNDEIKVSIFETLSIDFESLDTIAP